MGNKRKSVQRHSQFPAPDEIPPQEKATCVHPDKAGLDEQLGIMMPFQFSLFFFHWPHILHNSYSAGPIVPWIRHRQSQLQAFAYTASIPRVSLPFTELKGS